MQWGTQYFLTTTILNWIHILTNDEFKQIIIDEWKHQINNNNIKIYGFVIMPNHYHLIISFLPPKEPWETMRDMHKFISKKLIERLKVEKPDMINLFEVNKKDRKIQIWQRNHLAIKLYNRAICEQKLIYIHNNPMQKHWQLVHYPEQYYFSSAKFYYLEDKTFDFLTHYMD